MKRALRMGDNALMRNAIQRWRNAIVTVVVAGASLCAIASAHAQAQADTDFVAAKAAFERGDWRQLDALATTTVTIALRQR